MSYPVGYNLSSIFCLYLFTFWQTGTIKCMPNELLAVPVCYVPMDVETTKSKPVRE